MRRTYLIDSHSHIHNTTMWENRTAESLIEAARTAGVQKIVVIGTSHKDSLAALKFAEKHEGVFASYGLHPSVADAAWDFSGVSRLKPVAIGEVGLDYHYEPFSRERQLKLFEEQIDLALRMKLPLIFHVREAYADFYAVLDNFSSQSISGVVHSFCGSKKDLQKCLERGFYIGVNGMATYSTLPKAPIERVMLETDAPYLAPVPHRGEENEPALVVNVAEWLAREYQMTVEEVAQITTQNTEKLLGI